MRALITGGAGFIGSHLSEYLLRRGDEIFVIDNLSTGSMTNIEHLEKNAQFHLKIDDVANIEETAKIVDRCDVIYHLAAAVGVKLVVDQPLESLKNNIDTTEIILDLAQKKKKKVLITSTSEVYGKNSNVPFAEEDDRVYGSVYSTRWGYAFSKAIDEFLSLAYYREKGLPTVVVRLFNTVGPRQTGSYGMVIPRLIQQAMKNEALTVYGDGSQSRCFTSVFDAVRGIVALMDSLDTAGQVYNIGSHNEISIKKLAEKIISRTKSQSVIKYLTYEEAYEKGFEDMHRRVPDLTKIEKTIGYKPQYSLDQILDQIISFFETKNL